MKDNEVEPEPLHKNGSLIELLASWGPLPEEDSMPEIARPPVTCFDDWVDKDD